MATSPLAARDSGDSGSLGVSPPGVAGAPPGVAWGCIACCRLYRSTGSMSLCSDSVLENGLGEAMFIAGRHIFVTSRYTSVNSKPP